MVKTNVQEALAMCLDIWREHQDCKLGLGFKPKVALLRSEGAKDTEELYDATDKRIADAVDAMIDSLPPHQKLAIWRHCEICLVWPFQKLNYVDALSSAELALINLLSKNSATAIFF